MNAARPARPAAGWLPRLVAALGVLGVLAAGAALATGAAPADPSGFRYEPLPADGSIDFAIDAASPTFEFQAGVSGYRAFRLPDAGGPFYVDVRSFLSGPAHPARARIFYPVVAVLTDDFVVSRATDLDALRFDLPLLEGTVAPGYRLTLGVDPQHTRERYLVVFTPAPLLTARTLPQITTPDTAAEAARAAFLGAAPHGRLRISVRRGTEPAPAPAEAH